MLFALSTPLLALLLLIVLVGAATGGLLDGHHHRRLFAAVVPIGLGGKDSQPVCIDRHRADGGRAGVVADANARALLHVA